MKVQYLLPERSTIWQREASLVPALTAADMFSPITLDSHCTDLAPTHTTGRKKKKKLSGTDQNLYIENHLLERRVPFSPARAKGWLCRELTD